MHLANLPPIAALLLLVTSLGCMSADESLAQSKAHRQAGDRAAEEEALRDGLERHPDDVDLLMATSEFYLRPKPEEQYKPRLALHYAMRADRAARRTSPEAAALLHRAYRAAGGFEEAEVLLGKALETIGHPDAGNPSHPEPVDPDLLEPTLANLLEQNRRSRGEHLPTCAPEFALVPEGTYPLEPLDSTHPSEVRVDAFCAERRPRTTPPRRVARATDALAVCSQHQLRVCSASETLVLCGPMNASLGRHPNCDDGAYVRCCADPQPQGKRPPGERSTQPQAQ